MEQSPSSRESRSTKIRGAVERAVSEWRGDPPALSRSSRASAYRDREAHDAEVRPVGYGFGKYPRVSILYMVLRVVLWFWAVVRYYLGVLWDKLRRRDTTARRAVRLRQILEGLGPTFIKVGQQLSVRADLLPFEFCRELSQMLDAVPPMPMKRALSAIKRAVGEDVSQVFSELDPNPIGAGSLACVYKGRLRTGEWVAVKVRRPGIVRRLTADVRALAGLLWFAERLSLFKTGFTKNIRTELARMLLEETDFHREARNTEIFASEAEELKQRYLRAPRVHFSLCSEDVLVTDFVTGTFLSEILRALDRGDREFLAALAAQGIDLHQIARNLLLVAHWELLEGLLFHADPHPANICVQPGNYLVFIDFGSCGRLTDKYRRVWQQLYYALDNDDIQGMVDAAVALLEPLPRLDVESFRRDLELLFWDWVYAMNSDHSAWWEKASGMLWMRFAGIAQQYQVFMTAEIVRIFRATFIYDTTIFQLSRTLDIRDEYTRYHRQAGRRARRRLRKAFWRRIERGLKYEDYVEVEGLLRTGRQALARVQHFLDAPSPSFSQEVGKLAYPISLAFRLAVGVTSVYLVSLIGVSTYEWVTGQTLDVTGALGSLTAGAGFRVLGGLLVLAALRKTVSKLREREDS